MPRLWLRVGLALMAVVLAEQVEPALPLRDSKVLVFPQADGWISRVAYAPAATTTIYWDLGYLYDDLKGVHHGFEWTALLGEMKEVAMTLSPTDLHLRGQVLRQGVSSCSHFCLIYFDFDLPVGGPMPWTATPAPQD